MRVARALVLSPLVPLVAVAALGVAAGYRSVSGLAGFLLMWAAVMYPLVVALGLAGHLANRRFGCKAAWQFGWAGLLIGSLFGALWFGLLRSADGELLFWPTMAFAGTAGATGAATALVFWGLAVRERAV